MTEDWTLPMGMIDKWTLAHAALSYCRLLRLLGCLVSSQSLIKSNNSVKLFKTREEY